MAMPPEYQRARELAAILDSEEVLDRLQRRPVDAVERVAPDRYRVTAGPMSLEVRIIDDPSADVPPGWVGPRRFVLEVRPGEPR